MYFYEVSFVTLKCYSWGEVVCPLVLVLGRLYQEDCLSLEFENSLGKALWPNPESKAKRNKTFYIIVKKLVANSISHCLKFNLYNVNLWNNNRKSKTKSQSHLHRILDQSLIRRAICPLQTSARLIK